jgi:hypothetical protein
LGPHETLVVAETNPKSEYRNPKQIQMFQTEDLKQGRAGVSVSVIRALNFGFVSDFRARIHQTNMWGKDPLYKGAL